MTIKEGDLLWTGSHDFLKNANMTKFTHWVEQKRSVMFDSYQDLHRWSIENLEFFWEDIWEYFDVISSTKYSSILENNQMPGAQWFRGSQVNYAEHILRNEDKNPYATVLHFASENKALDTMSWAELGQSVRSVATALRSMGIGSGDRVVAYLPNTPETVIAMLATVSIGAIWSSASPEFGARTVMDRFKQISPKLIFAADGYHFNGKVFDRRNDLKGIVDSVPSIEHVIWHEHIGLGSKPDFNNASILSWSELIATTPPPAKSFKYTRVPFDHPLWILFSSGTTGLPKAIVHSHVGILVEQFKAGALHCNMTDKSVMFFYTTTGWMMWNALMVGPLVGGAAVLYEGCPTYPQTDALWRLAETAKVSLFGSSPTFIDIMRKEKISPNKIMSFDALESIILSGSPSTPETFDWLYKNIRKDLWVTSQSGGTEFCSALVAGVPNLPVYAGEIQARALGVDVRVFDDGGNEIIDETGELVVVQPMPSMPIYFWGDDNFSRYRETYFDTYDGIWRHGDLMKVNQRDGVFIYGRSDSTLNRFGVRIGSGEFYSILEGIEEISDSLIVCIELPNGKFYMPLFVKLKGGGMLSDELVVKINQVLRSEGSPRHIPEEIHQVPSIPYTLSGKKMEVPVRKLLLGWAADKSFSIDAMKDSSAMEWYINFALDYGSGS